MSQGGVLLFAAAIIALFYFSFSHNETCLSLGLDGTWYRVMFAYEGLDRSPFTQTGADALSGNFDAWYPLRPEFLLPHALALLFTAVVPATMTIFIVYSVFLALAIYTMARAVYVGRAIALAAGLLTPMLAGAGLIGQVARLFPLFEANPYWFQCAGLGLLIVAAFWALDAEGGIKTAIYIVTPTACLLLAVVSLAPHVLFMVPTVGAYSVGSLLMSRRWSDIVPRLLSGVLAIAVLIGLGVLTYYRAIIGYTAYQFFASEIAHPLGGWMALSTVFFVASSVGAWVVGLGMVGAAWTVWTGSGRLRAFAITHLAATALYFPIAYWFAFLAQAYRGSWPVYFETGMWPYAIMFALIAIAAALRLLLSGAAVILRVGLASRAIQSLRRHSAAAVFVGIFALIASYNIYAAVARVDHCSANAFNIRATPITDYLQRSIGLRPGMRFRGLAATFDAIKPGVPGDWMVFYGRDGKLAHDIGNEHRSVGLWKFGIPTLFQYHTFITPPYYLLLTDFLSRPDDKQLRSVIVMSHPDPAILQLWGVRYIVTDSDTAAGREVVSLPTPDIGPLRLMELSDPNLGDDSPTQVETAGDFRTALQIMHRPDFAGRRTVASDAVLAHDLVPASKVALVYEKNGFHLSAESAGNSILVLPVQYSHCWAAEGEGGPRLFRADAMQLGVGFTGRLDAKLVFRFGPVLAAGCRLDDLRDMSRLRIDQARTGPWRMTAPKSVLFGGLAR